MQPSTTELEQRVRQVVMAHAREFPEGCRVALSISEAATAAGEPVEAVRSADGDDILVIHAERAAALPDEASLREAVLRGIATVVWRRTFSSPSPGDLTAAAFVTDESGDGSLAEDIASLERLGRELVLAERMAPATRGTPDIDAACAARLDALAYGVANACDFYFNISTPRPDDDAARKFLSSARAVLDRYLAFRENCPVPLALRGLAYVAERPGLEFLRPLERLAA